MADCQYPNTQTQIYRLSNHSRLKHIRTHAWILILLIAIPSIAWTDNIDETKNRLQKIQQEMLTLQKKQARDKGKAGELQLRLSSIESQISKVSKQRHENVLDLGRKHVELKKLEPQKNILLLQMDNQHSALASQLRAAYQLGRQEKFKMLFNQQDPSTVGRMLTYYGYFNRSRVNEIEQARNTLNSLKNIEHEIAEQTSELESIASRLEQQHAELESSRSQRSAVIVSLKQEINKTDQSIQSLSKDQNTLQKLVDTLETTLKNASVQPPAGTAFQKLKGRISWPASGKINNQFDKPRHNSGASLKWRGIVIESAPGEEVRAISGGTVVFSDWMNGYGLLTIIDHGDSYMSLYGQNESLFKSVGEKVSAGEKIALVGKSGGFYQNGLYFEIRYKGKPMNPSSWCTTTGTQRAAQGSQ